MSLSEITDAHYRRMRDQWQIASRMFSGDFEPEQLLPRGVYESERNYEKRVQLSDFHRHTALLIGRLNGSLMQREDDTEREMGEVPEPLLSSVGPNGESYKQMLSKLADYLLLYNECFAWIRPTGGRAELHVVSPLRVPRTTKDKALMLGERRTSGSIMEKEKTETTYTVHTASGYETYVETNDDVNADKRLVEELSGTYSEDGEAFFVDEDGEPHPPIFRIRMPWDSPFGLSVAQSHQQLYRMRNELDMGSTAGLNSSIATVTGVTDEDREGKVVSALKDGDQLIFLPSEAEMESFELGTGNLEAAEKRVENKRRDMYRVAYQSLQDESSQSATEASVRRAESTAAALSTLAGVVESAEEIALRYVEQALNIQDYGGPAPQQSNISISWPRDFQRVDLQSDQQGED